MSVEKISRKLRERLILSLGDFVFLLTSILMLVLLLNTFKFIIFHSFVEMFCVVVAFSVFTVAWNARAIVKNNYLLLLGIGYLFTGYFDFLHTISYSDIDILTAYTADLPTQLWIVARFTEAISLLALPFFFDRSVKPGPTLTIYFLFTIFVTSAVFLGRFPVCFVEGEGLTPFKIYSEYAIILILLGSAVLLHRNRRKIPLEIYKLLQAAILFTVLAEIFFTLYIDVFEFVNALGHFTKFISYFLIYKALVEEDLKKPYETLFRELKKEEEIARRNVEELSNVFNLTAVGMAQMNVQKKAFTRVNEQFCRITGYSAEELLRKSFVDITHPEDVEQDVARFERAARGDAPIWVSEKRYIRKDGNIVWVKVTGSIIRDKMAGSDYSVAIIEDITEYREAQAQLRESEAKFRRFAESSKDVIWMATTDLKKMIFINQAYERLFGKSSRSIYEDSLSFMKLIHPDDIQNFKKSMERHINNNWSITYRIIRPDGELRWVRNESAPVYDKHGKKYLIMGIARDITQNKRLEEEQRHQREELEKIVEERTASLALTVEQLRNLTVQLTDAENRERKELAAILHDDLQQLLAAGGLHADRLRNSLESESQRQYAGIIIDVIDKAITSTRSLSYDLSPPVLDHGTMTDVIYWLVRRMKDLYELEVEVNIPVVFDVESDSLRSFIYRSIKELLFNIVKHAGVNKVWLSTLYEKEYILIYIADMGKGFDPATIYEDVQVRDSGFGLFNIQERLKFLGGSLKIDSRLGGGSRFVITLPLPEQKEPPIGKTDKPGIQEIVKATTRKLRTGQAGGKAKGNTIRIILVDDHPAFRQGLEALMFDEELLEVVAHGENGEEAVKLAEQYNPDLIIMDLAMPVMDGIAATARILQNQPDIRIIILSMHHDHELREHARLAGACAFHSKGHGTQKLFEKIYEVMPTKADVC